MPTRKKPNVAPANTRGWSVRVNIGTPERFDALAEILKKTNAEIMELALSRLEKATEKIPKPELPEDEEPIV